MSSPFDGDVEKATSEDNAIVQWDASDNTTSPVNIVPLAATLSASSGSTIGMIDAWDSLIREAREGEDVTGFPSNIVPLTATSSASSGSTIGMIDAWDALISEARQVNAPLSAEPAELNERSMDLHSISGNRPSMSQRSPSLVRDFENLIFGSTQSSSSSSTTISSPDDNYQRNKVVPRLSGLFRKQPAQRQTPEPYATSETAGNPDQSEPYSTSETAGNPDQSEPYSTSETAGNPDQSEPYSTSETAGNPDQSELYSTSETAGNPDLSEPYSTTETAVNPDQSEPYSTSETAGNPDQSEPYSTSETAGNPDQSEPYSTSETAGNPDQSEPYSTSETAGNPDQSELYSTSETAGNPDQSEPYSTSETAGNPDQSEPYSTSETAGNPDQSEPYSTSETAGNPDQSEPYSTSETAGNPDQSEPYSTTETAGNPDQSEPYSTSETAGNPDQSEPYSTSETAGNPDQSENLQTPEPYSTSVVFAQPSIPHQKTARYEISQDVKGGGKGRPTRNSSKTPLVGRNFFHGGIEKLFDDNSVRNGGKYTPRGIEDLGSYNVLIEELKIWEQCIELMKPPQHIHIHSGLTGNRGGALNTHSKITYGQPNPYYLRSDRQTNSSKIINEIFLDSRKRGAKLCVILIVTEIQVDRIRGLHTLSLVANFNEKKTEYYIHDPLKKYNPYRLPLFVQKLKLGYFNHLNVLFGSQGVDDLMCFHRTIDWVAQLCAGRVGLADSKHFIELHSRKDANYQLKPAKGVAERNSDPKAKTTLSTPKATAAAVIQKVSSKSIEVPVIRRSSRTGKPVKRYSHDEYVENQPPLKRKTIDNKFMRQPHHVPENAVKADSAAEIEEDEYQLLRKLKQLIISLTSAPKHLQKSLWPAPRSTNDALKCFLNGYLTDLHMSGVDEDELKFYTKKWEEFKFSSKVLGGVCCHIDRQCECEEGHKGEVYQLAVLVGEVLDILATRFKPNLPLIKKCIDTLIV